jgi:2-polyprenyl-3-methyl-5-hydroxy-6-metoxy-1,4-benzoquinol methylase
MKNIYSGMLRKCLTCGFVTANLDLKSDDIDELYDSGYFKGEEYLDYVKNKVIFQKNFRRRVSQILTLAGREKIKSVLDIGCAYGFFGEVVRAMIPEATYLGVDISEEAIAHVSDELNLEVIHAPYLEYDGIRKFTDVCMWDVIEHLQHPDRFLEKIHSDLEPDGRLWITTGDIDALVPRIMKRRWRMIHPPTHLHYFSARTLGHLLTRKGFEVRRISYPRVTRGLQQIFYSLFMLGEKPGKWVRKFHSAIPPKMSVNINTFDIMFVMAVKTG